MTPYISICINADTRAGFQDNESVAGSMFNGTRSVDFLIAGVQNKINFFRDFPEKEVILFIDQHEAIPENILNTIRGMVDTLVIRKHDKRFGDRQECSKFNDLNYLSALQLARGQYIAHFDQDCAAFARNDFAPNMLIDLLGQFDYVSYPSHWSPKAVDDPEYDYMWCSTRFFMCKRETLDFTEIQKCLLDSDYLYGKYPVSKKNPWTEHVLGILAKYKSTKEGLSYGKGVFYPKIDLDNYAIFSWSKYIAGTLLRLNKMPYDEVKSYIEQAGGIQYPNDIVAH